MTTTSDTHARVRDYLTDLDRALRDLPGDRRAEIVRDVRAHIETALADSGADATNVERILHDLGSPREIADAAYAETPARRAHIAGRDVATIILLLVGGLIIPLVGWIVAVVLLWTSTAWRVRDKIVGTVLVPGGLLAPLAFAFLAVGSATGCSQDAVVVSLASARGALVSAAVDACASGSQWGSVILSAVLGILVVGGPLFSTVWLIRTARKVG